MTRTFAPASWAVAALAMIATASPLQAASNLNSSKSNYKEISNAADEAACIRNGGTVVMEGQKKLCSLPAAAPSN